MGLSGTVQEVALADLIQMACLEGSDRELRISWEGRSGAIWISKGDVVHAEAGDLTGEDAFYAMMRWEGGEFTLKRAEPPERTIQVPWNFLLIEGQRQADEGGRTDEEEAGLTVLIVDDSPTAVRAVKSALRSLVQGGRFLEARDGREALETLEEEHPDLITLDMNMPVMDGGAALKYIMIRSPAPVVLLSGVDPKEVGRIMDFLRLGGIDFVPKPSPGMPWEAASKRLERLAKKARSLQVESIRRAPRPIPLRKKPPPGGPASRLVLLVGGIGGLLEIQKLAPRLPLIPGTAYAVCQDMARELYWPIQDLLGTVSLFHVAPPIAGQPLQAGALYLTTWDPVFPLDRTEGGLLFAPPITGDETASTLDELLTRLARMLGPDLTVVLMTGAEIQSEDTIVEAASAKAHLLLQDPRTALDAEPLRRIQALELEEALYKVEDLADLLIQGHGLQRTDLERAGMP